MRILTTIFTMITTMRFCRPFKINHRRLITALTLALALFSFTVYAQKDGGGKKNAEMVKELQEFKIKYLIQEADITKEQQPEFVKIYTELNNAKLALIKANHESLKALKAKNSPTDEDYYKVAEEIAKGKTAEGAIDMKYYQQFKKLLTPKQLFKLKEAELKFNRKMMQMRDKKK